MSVKFLKAYTFKQAKKIFDDAGLESVYDNGKLCAEIITDMDILLSGVVLIYSICQKVLNLKSIVVFIIYQHSMENRVLY